MTTPILGLTELEPSQSQPHVVVNAALRALEAAVQISVISITDTPPGSPSDGDRYIVDDGGTGDWAGQDGKVAYYSGGWQFLTPQAGWLAFVQSLDATYQYTGGSPATWEEFSSGGGGGGPSTATAIDLGMFFPGNPGSSQLLFKFSATRDLTFPANFSGAVGHIGTNPTSSFVMNVNVDGATVGTITVSTGGAFTFATTGGNPVEVLDGDVIEIVAPSSTDGTAADISATLPASLIES